MWIMLVLVLEWGIASARAETWEASDYAWFAAGGLSGFVIHESAHAAVAESLGLRPRLEIRHKPVPFAIIKYDLIPVKDSSGEITYYTDRDGNPISNGGQKRFVIASAGINSQNIVSEWILTQYPRLADESRPYLKGILAFDILTSMGYALVGRKDPDGDLRGMSEALKVNDLIIGGIVLLPAAMDLYRYYHPDSVWAPWLDRGAKGYLLGFSIRW
ncbi:MAG: hypothetical protein HY283_10130 [Nitrospirae bacterium]|nr:hypothetical protein [Nitrospirota bacterium]